ncbi:hypothetical protein K474DRAFT_1676131 [Panus rudis PR-1116 ss-1]|nr:hypothetical protein K474DRAFT_1676131 [Panus rudis PR-1116 ss-1]
MLEKATELDHTTPGFFHNPTPYNLQQTDRACIMATRLFALIVGIDKYKSGNIWNLETCVDDAQQIKRWLTHDMHVPRSQICMLADKNATQRNIEDRFMSHLVNNPVIERGDAILIYFAGHGSCLRAPRGWFGTNAKSVEVLCPYDHDTKGPSGRVAGISDRSLDAMIRDLVQVKGDNVTLVLDTSFSSPSSRLALRERRHTRWTPTSKATPDDLDTGLWRSALGYSALSPCRGFAGIASETHTVLAACKQGQSAIETKGGGRFTQALLAVKNTKPVHNMTNVDFVRAITKLMEEEQQPVSVGLNRSRILFNGIPFTPDVHFVPVEQYDTDRFRVEMGAIHGVSWGTEFSVHKHNCRGSVNPSLLTFSAIEIHPTWCLARSRSNNDPIVRDGWARITRWNNRTPFRVHFKKSLFSLFRRCRLRRQIPPTATGPTSRPGVSMVRVKSASQADVSVTLRSREIVLERHDGLIVGNCRRIIHLSSHQTSTDLRVLDAAAHFHLHLHRQNPHRPLLRLVTMELFRLDASTWTRTSGNLLVDGRAQIVDDEKNSIYSVVLHNYSDYDLWPYLAYLDSSGYGISMIYHPSSKLSKPPLRRHSHLVIGSGTTESEALSFSLADGADIGAGFLKLFASSSFTPMTSIEQGPSSSAPVVHHPIKGKTKASWEKTMSDPEVWDSVVSCVTVVRGR